MWLLALGSCASQPPAPPAPPARGDLGARITAQPAPLPTPPGTRFLVFGDGWRVRPAGTRIVAVGRDRFVSLSTSTATLWDPAIGRVAALDLGSPAVLLDAFDEEYAHGHPVVTPDGAWVLSRGASTEGSEGIVGRRLDPVEIPGRREASVVRMVTTVGWGSLRYAELLHLRWDDDHIELVRTSHLSVPQACLHAKWFWWESSGRSLVCERAEGWAWVWPDGEPIVTLPGMPEEVGFSVDGRVLASFDGRSVAVADVVEGLRFVEPGWAYPVGVGELLVGDSWRDALDGRTLAQTAPSAVSWSFYPDGSVFTGISCVGSHGASTCPAERPAGSLDFEVNWTPAHFDGRGWSVDFRQDGSVAVIDAPGLDP